MTASTATGRPPRPRVSPAIVSIGGDDVYEDLFGVGSAAQQLLVSLGYAASLRMGMAWLDREIPADVVVLYIAMGGLTAEQITRLEERVTGGLGLLVLHSTSVFPSEGGRITEPFDRAFALYGSRYASHGPQPHSSRFTVHFDPDHELTAGLADFEIEHEHYQVELAPGSRVVAWRSTEAGREPIVHVGSRGAGRVCYLQLGHDTRVFDEPAARELIARSVAWLDQAAAPERKH